MTGVDKTYQQAIQTIFITDDDEDDQVMLKEALKDICPACKIENFRTCGELYSMLEHFKADLLFVDLEMPGKNGLECIRDLRANSKTADMPIVVFSSTNRAGNITAAYDIGADLFMMKPSFYQSLIETLKKLLSLDWRNREAIKSSHYINGSYVPFQ